MMLQEKNAASGGQQSDTTNSSKQRESTSPSKIIKGEDSNNRETFKGLQIYQSAEEIQELLLSELENLFDRPCLIPVQIPQAPGQPQSQTPFKVGLEKDKTNTFLITNPQAIFKVFQRDQFLALPETTQCVLLERLDDILLKCAHNALVLTDHIQQSSPSQLIRISQTAINELKNKAKTKALMLSSPENSGQSPTDNSPMVLKSPPSRHQAAIPHTTSGPQDHDLIQLIINFGLKNSYKHPLTTKKIIELVRKLTLGRRFLKCHVEFIYQYLKVKSSQLTLRGKCAKALAKVDTAIKLLQNMFEFKYEPGPSNYYYFSGYLSGLQVNTRNISSFDMQKGYATAMWFQIQENMLQDDKSLPVLFNCFVQGAGGFECYFKNRQIYFRSLGKNYTPPTMESNGFYLGDITPRKWYFFAIDHQKPFMSRPAITYIINEKQGTQVTDYPTIQKNQKVSMMILCQNFVGLMSSFMFFKESLGAQANKLANLCQSPPFEYGFHSQHQMNHLKPEVFDKLILDKLLLMYTPERTSNKIVYDCVDMRDADLMINSGVCHTGPKAKLFYTGGLNSLLPLLEIISGISILNKEQEQLNLDSVFNEYLKLIVHILSGRSYHTQETHEYGNFFTLLFFHLSKLPYTAVNPQTIQSLADIRFHIGDVARLQDEFFKGIIMSSDWWINTENQEVLNEYWLFVKAIYQQAPKAYNQLFSIQNLIDLMVKISEIRDGGHCCEFHRDTFHIFYHGLPGSGSQEPLKKQMTGAWVLLDKNEATEGAFMRPNVTRRGDQIITKQGKIHNIEKYLGPIAGVLEGIMTSGGSEVLDHIKLIARALTVKTSPCFHLQMLKLLKVLLGDQIQNNQCASPEAFATSFLQAKGLQVLLNLCKNSSFDVKSMCLKLIDVLSTHTHHLKMSIDMDVITYLCNIILPQSLIDQAHKFTDELDSNRYQIAGDEENKESISTGKKLVQQFEVMEDIEDDESAQKPSEAEPFQVAQDDQGSHLLNTPQFEDSQELENQMNQLLAKEPPVIVKSSKKFGGLSFQLPDEEENNEEPMEDDEAQDITENPGNKEVSNRLSLDAFIEQTAHEDIFMQNEQDQEDEELLIAKPPPPAPKNRANKMTFDFGDDDDDDEDEDEVELSKPPAPKPKNLFFQSQTKKRQLTLDQENDDEEFQKNKPDTLFLENEDSGQQKGFKSDEDLIDSLEKEAQMIDDTSFGNKKMLFMNTQKIPQNKSSKQKTKSGGMSSIAKFKGKTLDIAQEEEKKPSKTQNKSSKFGGGGFPSLNIEEVERNMPPPPKRMKPSFSTIKGEDQTNFANENVMSKSNLRDRKQFVFGGGDDSSSEEESKNEEKKESGSDQEMDLPVMSSKKPPKFGFNPPSLKRRGGPPPQLQLDDNMEENRNSPLTEDQNRIEEPLVRQQPQIGGNKKKLFLAGTTGATSDDSGQERQIQEEVKFTPDIEEEVKEEPVLILPQIRQNQPSGPSKPKMKMLAIDTEEINKQFTFGGEKGEIMMSEDEELRKLEDEIEYFAGMCIAAMNRKKPTDPIRYEGGKEKISFDQQYLQNEDDDEGEQPAQKPKQSKKDFNALKSVRGIKKIVLQDKGNDQGSLMNTYNTINEELSGTDSSQQSSSRSNKQQDINFPGLLSSSLVEPLNNTGSDNLHVDGDHVMDLEPVQDLVVDTQDQGMTFAQLPGMNFDDNEQPQRTSDGLLVYNNQLYANIPQQEQTEAQSEQNIEMQEVFVDSHLKHDEFYTKELENLYTSCLEWIISRAPSSLYENIVIDECDKVNNLLAFQLLLTLVSSSNNFVRQRALTDLEMLSKWDPNNGVQMMKQPQFHPWLLELLMPYQEISNKNQGKLSEQAMAVYDIGCKLHTHLLKNSCINSEEEAYKMINFVARWPNIVHAQYTYQIKGRQEKDIQTAQILSRVLLCQLVSHIKDEIGKTKPSIGKGAQTPIWQNLVFLSSIVEEIVFASIPSDFGLDKITDHSFDFNSQPLLKWIQEEGYLLHLTKVQGATSIWADRDLLETLASTFDHIYSDSVTRLIAHHPTNDASYQYFKESIHHALLDKSPSSDNFNALVEVLTHDMSPYKATTAGGAYNFPNSGLNEGQKVEKAGGTEKKQKKGILGNVLGLKLGGSSSSSKDVSQTQNLQNLETVQRDPNAEVLLQNIVNLLCIGSAQSDSVSLLQIWLDRLERFTKFLILVSETWKSQNSTIYQLNQKKFSESITFVITFLFKEIQAQKSPKYRNNLNMLQKGAWNHQENIRVTDLYNNALKNIMLFFLNVLQTRSAKQTSQEGLLSASQLIYHNILVVKSQQDTKSPLRGLLHGNFQLLDDHFPKCFLTEDWQAVFFYNDLIKPIVKSHLNSTMLNNFRKRRDEYARHQISTWDSNDKTKDDIFCRMDVDANIVISTISSEEHERKNQVAIVNENFVRNQGHMWKSVKKNQIGGNGMWKCDPTRLKLAWQNLSDGTRPIMRECHGPKKFQFFENMPELEKKIFGQSISSQEYINQNPQDFDILFLSDYPYLLDPKYTQLQVSPFSRASSIDKRSLVNQVERPQLFNGLQGFVIEDNQARKISDDDDIEDPIDDEEEEVVPNFKIAFTKPQEFNEPARQSALETPSLGAEPLSNSTQVVSFLNRMLTLKDKKELRKHHVKILQEILYERHLKDVKFKEIISDMRCEILKPFYKRSGIVSVTSYEMIFFDDLLEERDFKSMGDHSVHYREAECQNTDNIFFFKYNKQDDQLRYKIIPLPEIKELQRRRWLGKKTALEVFLMSGKSVMLNFPNTENRDAFAKKLIRQRGQRCYNLNYSDTLDPKKILKKRELTEKWLQWKISNFEYITLLNQLAGRSYSDLSQYPVFPWIFVDYLSQQAPDIQIQFNQVVGAPAGFRDLNKNMQLQGSAERQAEFKRKYEDADSFETLQDRYHCGSHYSNPGIVLHYLSRVSPYLDALVQLHGKNLDSPDRGFHSIHDSLSSALSDHADVRELIPEFFYCPELFINQNRINFGTKQDGVVVDDVTLPPWSQNDPYLFVIYLREAFESQYVSQALCGWIDYIFGFKQRDSEAERCLNVYSRMTYEDGIDIEAISDTMIRQGYQEQIYNYGQTPSQLFVNKQKHPQKLPRSQALKYNLVVDTMAKIKVYKPVASQQNPGAKNQQQPQQIVISQEAILKAKFIDDQTIVGLSKDGNLTYFFWVSRPHEMNPNTPFTCCEDKKRKFDNSTRGAAGLDGLDRSIKRFDFPLLVLNTQKCVLKGGLWSGQIHICPIDQLSTEPQSILHGHSTTVTCIVATSNEKTVITGSKSGDVIVWNYAYGSIGCNASNWTIRSHKCDHESQISSIYIHEDMNMYLTSSLDGSVKVYNLWNDLFLRTFYHPKLSPVHSAVLTQVPLPSCCFFSREDHHWYSYSFNNPGHMLEKQKEECSHMISPLIIKDSYSMDRLVYGTEKGYLIFRQLPMLKQVKKLQVSVSYPVLSLIVSPDRRFLLVGCGDSGLNVVTEPFINPTSISSNSSTTIGTISSGRDSNTVNSNQTISQVNASMISLSTMNSAR